MRTSRPFQAFTNRELFVRFAEAGMDHPDYDAIMDELLRRPIDHDILTHEDYDHGAPGGELTGFDQEDLALENERARALGMARLTGVFEISLRESGDDDMKQQTLPLPEPPEPEVIELSEDTWRALRATAAAVHAAKPGDSCPACRGTGRNQMYSFIRCSACDGTGILPEMSENEYALLDEEAYEEAVAAGRLPVPSDDDVDP